MYAEIKEAALKFSAEIDGNPVVRVISHHDTDGITSASILATTLQRAGKRFVLSIVKDLNSSFVKEILSSEYKVIVFLDLGASFVKTFEQTENKKIFVFDHHEIKDKIPESITCLNPHLNNNEEISAAGITYLFAKEFDEKNKDLSNFAVLGMIGDILEGTISRLNNSILADSSVVLKKGLKICSSTRPLHKALEFSNIFIEGITGSEEGAIELLREADIKIKDGSKYRTILDLSKEELSRLVTALSLRSNEELIGNIYLLKFFNRSEDARELSALINACGRLESADIGVALCLGCMKAKAQAESIYSTYKHLLVNALRLVNLRKINERNEGKNYLIINAGDKIKDTIIGTVTSILASSCICPKGTVIVGLARRNDDNIKVSARIVGKSEINLYEILKTVCAPLECEYGGHKRAAGAIIPLSKEKLFLDFLEKELQMHSLEIKISTKD